MTAQHTRDEIPTVGGFGPPNLKALLPPPPLGALQPVLGHIVRSVARAHPALFRRLGASASKRFVIDPQPLPFVLVLEPDADNPRLSAHHRGREGRADVVIAGRFSTLLDLIDAEIDSDALFFSRDIKVTGDTEAIVALRNALDDMDETLADSVTAAFGPLKGAARKALELASRLSTLR